MFEDNIGEPQQEEIRELTLAEQEAVGGAGTANPAHPLDPYEPGIPC